MRVITCVLVLITLLVGAFLGYCYYGTQMKIISVVATVTPAQEALGTFNEATQQVENGTFSGTKYREAEYAMPNSFSFLTLTVRMENPGLLPMDWIRISVVPDAADVFQLASARTPSLAGSNRADFSTTILTRTGADTLRKIKVLYYVLGRPFEAEFNM